MAGLSGIVIDRPLRFEIERPVEYRFTDVRDATRFLGRTVNISSGGVLFQTDQSVTVGRKLELTVRMAKLAPEAPEVDLRLLGVAVRCGQGWAAAHIRKHKILPRPL